MHADESLHQPDATSFVASVLNFVFPPDPLFASAVLHLRHHHHRQAGIFLGAEEWTLDVAIVHVVVSLSQGTIFCHSMVHTGHRESAPRYHAEMKSLA